MAEDGDMKEEGKGKESGDEKKEAQPEVKEAEKKEEKAEKPKKEEKKETAERGKDQGKEPSAASGASGDGDNKKRVKISKLGLEAVEAKLKQVEEKMGGIGSRYARSLLARKAELTKK